MQPSLLALGVAQLAPSASRPIPGAGPDLGWMATVVAIILVCILATAWGVRRFVGSAWRSRAGRRQLRVVDVLPLGGRRQVVVVRCYDRTFALGLGDKEVSLVAELDPAFVEPAAEPGAGVRPELRARAEEFRGLLLRAVRPTRSVDVAVDDALAVPPPPAARPPARQPRTEEVVA